MKLGTSFRKFSTETEKKGVKRGWCRSRGYCSRCAAKVFAQISSSRLGSFEARISDEDVADNDDKSNKIEDNRSKYTNLVAILIDIIVYLEGEGEELGF